MIAPKKKRIKFTQAQLAQLDIQIVAALTEDHPQSVRHVYYLMTNPRLPVPVPKTDSGYRKVQGLIKELRLAGQIPFGWVTDATRQGYHVNTFQDAADFVRSMAPQYRGDLWQGADTHVSVWCESRSIQGVIEDDCQDLAVSLFPCGGFASLTLTYDGAKFINYATGNGKNKLAKILYIGDYDPAGVLIDESAENGIRQHLAPAVELEFFRLAITEEQISEYDLPTKARKEGDKRSLQVLATVEAEAMPAGILRQMLRDQIERLLPEGAQDAAMANEESVRENLGLLATIADQW